MVTGIGDGYLLQRMASELSGNTWNGPVCGICGVGYLGSHSCSGGITPSNLPMPAPVSAPSCQHCWCGDPGPYNGKPHVSCCMCATRKVQ